MQKNAAMPTLCCAILLFSVQSIAAPPRTDSSLNNPYSIRPLKVQLLLLTLDQINVGAGIQADYHFKHALLEAQYRRVYVTLGGKPDAGDKKIYTTNSTNNFSNIDISGEYYFADYLVNKKYKNILSENSTSYTYNVGYGKARRIYALKAGLFISSGFTFADSAAHYATNYTTTGFAAGLARKRIDKIQSSRHHDGVREFYLQILSGATSLETMQVKAGQSSAPATSFTNIGWRMGGQRYGEHIYVGYELGERPGLTNPDKFKASIPFNYFVINFGITIYGNEKWR